MPQREQPRKIMVIAGEASGDLHGSRLVRALRQRDPALSFAGVGGEALQAAGVKIFFDAHRLAVVGITEVLSQLAVIFKGLAVAKNLLKTFRPDLLILIDFPDFNLHVAARAKKLGIPVLYYISPQIWAWRSGRVRTIKKRVDHMAVILPFEAEFYRVHSVPVTYVGHPLMDRPVLPTAATVPTSGADTLLIGLLPGSRNGEVKQHLPLMLDAAGILQKRIGKVRFAVSLAPGVDRHHLETLINRHPAASCFELVEGGAANIYPRCKLVVAVSGTVTLETALAGVPMVVIYKVSPLSYRLAKALIKVAHISLVNLIAERAIVPELIQDDASPQKIAQTVANLLAAPSQLEQIRVELSRVRSILGGPGASERVADIALEMMDMRK